MILGGTPQGFPEQDINVPYEQMITDGRNINLNPYTVENPHPGFGKDPNILNEYGHTEFPMWIDSKIEYNNDGTGKRLVVNNKAEFEKHMQIGKTETPAPANVWPK
jgi:hypothetical protein